jgi:hypothetical protein
LAKLRAIHLCYNYHHLLLKDKEFHLVDYLVLDDDILLGGAYSSNRQKQLLRFFQRIDVTNLGYIHDITLGYWTEEFSNSLKDSVFIDYFLGGDKSTSYNSSINVSDFCYAMDKFLIKTKAELALDAFSYLAKFSGASNVPDIDMLLYNNTERMIHDADNADDYLQNRLTGIAINLCKLMKAMMPTSTLHNIENTQKKKDQNHPNMTLLKLLNRNAHKIVVKESEMQLVTIDFYEFQELVKKSNDLLLFPLIQLQQQMRIRACGIQYWERRREQAIQLAVERRQREQWKRSSHHMRKSLKKLIRGVSNKIFASFHDTTTTKKKSSQSDTGISRNRRMNVIPSLNTPPATAAAFATMTADNKPSNHKKKKLELIRKRQSTKAMRKLVREDSRIAEVAF